MIRSKSVPGFGQTTGMPAASPIYIDPLKCTGCNRCVNICQVDLFVPGSTKGSPPVVLYPGECWYCGCCVVECPVDGAIGFKHPLINQVRWISRDELLSGNLKK